MKYKREKKRTADSAKFEFCDEITRSFEEKVREGRRKVRGRKEKKNFAVQASFSKSHTQLNNKERTHGK